MKATTADGQFARGQGAYFLILLGVMGIAAPILMRITWQANSELHTIFELTAIVLAIVIAHLTFIYHRHSRRDAQFFFVAFGFLAAALLDIVHVIVTSTTLRIPVPSPLYEATPWSWLAARVALAGFFLLNAATLSSDRSRDKTRRARTTQYLWFIAILVASVLIILLLVPLPKAMYFGLLISRPQELAVAIPYGLAFALYYRKRAQVQDPLFRWVLTSIVINLAIQLFYIPWSKQLYDAAFNWAHIAKIASYFVMLLGLAGSITNIIDELRSNRDEIRRQNALLSTEVTERKRAEDTIRIYRDIVDNMPSGVYVIRRDDPDDLGSFRFILGNRGADRATGQPIGPLLNQRIDEAIPVLMETEFPAVYKRVLDSQERVFMGDIFDPGDEEREETFFEVWFVPLAQNHLAAIFENTTERKQIERDLIASKHDLSEAQALAHLGSWVWNISTNRLAWSDELYRIYGYEPEEAELSFDFYMEHIHPSDREVVQQTIAHTLKTGKSFNYYHRIVTATADVRIVHARGQLETQEDKNGERRPVQMWGTAQDVTEQRLIEEASRRNGIKLAQALSLSKMGHWDLDLTSNQVDISAELAPIFGLGSQATQLQFSEFIDLIHPDDRGSMQAALNEAIEKHSLLRITFRILLSDGSERGIEGIGTLVLDESGKPASMWGTGQDVTEHLRLESQLRHNAVQLEASNRELQDFAYIASHDLQEPLRKISAFGDRLVQVNQDKLDERSLDYLNRMQDAAHRMQTLINDLLTLSRVTTRGRSFTSVDLNRVAEGVLRDLERQIESSGGQVEIGPLPTITADRAQMQQLFQNLISNGLKFHREDTPPVVRVFVEAASGTADPNGVSESNGAGASHQNGETEAKAIDMPTHLAMVTIVVEDNGIGFDSRYTDKIFQPFQRLHGRNSYEGTGIGLAITRKILERHSGSITAQSEVGVGTRFVLTLPKDSPGPNMENGDFQEFDFLGKVELPTSTKGN
ncbi:MAG: PAS domain-containing protein [Caldilineaceae bacterium]|nr:PAS domain-containing protein [Caldilineaceae bacterium]